MITDVTIVRLPGNMCDHRLWAGLGEQAGLGWTDVDLSRDSSVPEMAAHALAAAPGRLLPLGFSMGGIVALEMAHQAPGRIAAMALLDTNPTADLPERAAARPAQQAAVLAGRLKSVVVDELKPNYLAQQSRSDARLRALLLDMAVTLGPETFVRQSEALRTRADRTAVLADFAPPLFVACGLEDTLCPPAWHRAMAAQARNATLHVIEGAGHMLPLEQPAVLAGHFAAWLDSLGAT